MTNDPFQMQRELRYGAPLCDQILIGRYFTIGYSWYFRQAKWTLELINRQREIAPNLEGVKRLNNFRADMRIPKRFRAGLGSFKASGYDRGHLAASANHDLASIANSETFLLSNMSPQKAGFNRGIWSRLEGLIRDLDEQDDILETFVLTCPIFYFQKPVATLKDTKDEFGIELPIPHGFVKSVLTENVRGRIQIWTFQMDNEDLPGVPGDYLVKTYDAEQYVGGRFWDRVSGADLHAMKKVKGAMWEASSNSPTV